MTHEIALSSGATISAPLETHFKREISGTTGRNVPLLDAMSGSTKQKTKYETCSELGILSIMVRGAVEKTAHHFASPNCPSNATISTSDFRKA